MSFQALPPISMSRDDGASWTALVARTGGMREFGQARVNVVAGDAMPARWADCALRVIVQSYAASDVGGDGVPDAGARPLASAQRAVTLDALALGTEVSLVDTDPAGSGPRVVVAWIEPGHPDLEFDGLMAEPAPGAMFARERLRGHAATIVFGRASLVAA